MSVLLLLILASLVVALLFLGGFIWAVKAGQYDDTSTPSLRLLTEEAAPSNEHQVGRVAPRALAQEMDERRARSDALHRGTALLDESTAATSNSEQATRQRLLPRPTFSFHPKSESNQS